MALQEHMLLLRLTPLQEKLYRMFIDVRTLNAISLPLDAIFPPVWNCLPGQTEGSAAISAQKRGVSEVVVPYML